MNTSMRKVKYRRLNTNQCSSTINTRSLYVRGVAAECKGWDGQTGGYLTPAPVRGVHFSAPLSSPWNLCRPTGIRPRQRWEIFMTVVRSPHFTSARPVYWPPPNYVCISIHFYLSTYYRLVPCAAIMAWCECTHANEQFLRMFCLSHFSRWSRFAPTKILRTLACWIY